MLTLLIAAAAAGAPAVDRGVVEAAHAISSGRLDQAREMIGTAIAAGASGPVVDRLMADLALASGRNADALAVYKGLLERSPKNMILAERAAIAALKLGKIDEATRFAELATAGPAASWRAWNARGVAADLRRDWGAADTAYARAAEIVPNSAEVANNIGWSQLLRGNWAEAIAPLERAAAIAPKTARIAANLELARAAIDDDLPHRQPNESDTDWAARLNDAGVAAHVRGERVRAVAAFARALEARGLWYQRAANNLQLAQSAQ